MSTDILFDGFEKLMPILRKVAPHLRYLIVDEVLHRKRTQQLARVNFSPLDLAPYLPDAAPPHDDEDLDDEPSSDEEEDGDDDVPDDEGAEPLGELADVSAPEPTGELDRLCEAAARWMRHVARETMTGRAACTFKVWLYTLKGEYLGSGRFIAENSSYQPPIIAPPGSPPAPAPQLPALIPPPVPPLTAPAPPPVFEAPARGQAVALALGPEGRGQLVFLDPDTIPEARAWRALGQASEDLLRRSGLAYGNIIELQSRTVVHQAAQLDKSNALIESLATQLLAARRLKEVDEAERQVDERQIRVREELGKTFLSELGSLGRVLASSKLGVPPELAELGDLVSSSPELAEAIRDPNVRAMLKDDKTRKELAQLLVLAAKRPAGDPSPST